MIRSLILRMTHRVWNREISRLLGRAYERRWIDSRQYHQLAAMFDPTQTHCEVGRVVCPIVATSRRDA
jgi:hypothetical protein